MAVIKAVNSKAGIGKSINYITKEEKTEKNITSGYNCQPETAWAEMEVTKKAWGKEDGRTYKHYVQSFHKDEDITPEQAHQIAREFVESCEQFKGFEVLYATHQDREHVHTHFIVNSVNFEDGHKFNQSRKELQEMKDLSDEIVKKHGLKVCEKGRTFEGRDREETTAYSKETFNLLKKAEAGEAESYIQNIALAVYEEKQTATSQDEFIQGMEQRGYLTDWQDSHKYITWTDKERQGQGEKKCKARNSKLEKHYNMDLSKEGLLDEFERNKQEQERAREQIAATDRELQATDRNLQKAIRQLHESNSRAGGENRGTGAGQPEITAEQYINQKRIDNLERASLESAKHQDTRANTFMGTDRGLEKADKGTGAGEGNTETATPGIGELAELEKSIAGCQDNVINCYGAVKTSREGTAGIEKQADELKRGLEAVAGNQQGIKLGNGKTSTEQQGLKRGLEEIAGNQQQIREEQRSIEIKQRGIAERIGKLGERIRGAIEKTMQTIRNRRGR